MKFEKQVHYQRFMLGIICGLLPVLCLLFGLLGGMVGINNPEWYVSISATYFANSNMCMIGALCLCAFFLFTYQGYDLGDKVLTTISGISALLIVACPCSAMGTAAYLGLFALPAAISNVIHAIAAAALFLAFALMILTQFTKGGRSRRNIIYYICGVIMLLAMGVVAIGMFVNFVPYMTMICEFIMLEAFAIAWIIKSDIFPNI
jgi:hypothetical protein